MPTGDHDHATGRVITRLDDGWRFRRGDRADRSWQAVRVPHDWSIAGPYAPDHPSGKMGGFLPSGVAEYEIDLELPDPRRRRCRVEFDGVQAHSEVRLDGAVLGSRPSGTVSFGYDLTTAVAGRHTLRVRTDTSAAPNARWHAGSGIYRPVRLVETGAVRIAPWGVWVRVLQVDERQAVVRVEHRIDNLSEHEVRAKLDWAVAADDATGVITSTGEEVIIEAAGQGVVSTEIVISDPRLWSPETPQRYRVESMIGVPGEDGSEISDTVTTRFGVRTVEFTSSGLRLNGEPIKLRGVCEHHNYACVGAAVPQQTWRRRLQLIKDMGANAVRTGHAPFGDDFHELCDELGLLVLTDLFDGWDVCKAAHDYGEDFAQWWRHDAIDTLLRLRNRSSIVAWCIGNEVPRASLPLAPEITALAHEIDPSRPTTIGRGWEGVDVPGFNGDAGVPGFLESFHAEHPGDCVIITEEPHTLQTRGFYRTKTWWRDIGRPRFDIPDLTAQEVFDDGALLYNSSYDNSGVRNSVRNAWRRTRDLPFVAGEFRWTGHDYLGESPGWPARMYNHGIIDLCGFPKDHYHLYRRMWTDEPFVHLLPHWTHPGREGVIIPIIGYANAERVELWLDDERIGDGTPIDEYALRWDVAYRPGRLTAIGFSDGVEVARTVITTATTPVGIRLDTDAIDLDATTPDVAHIAVTAVDAAAAECPTAAVMVGAWCDGPAEIIGLDNGDPLDLTPNAAPHATFNGQALIMAANAPGEDPRPIVLSAAALCGDRWFDEATTVTVAVASVALRGNVGSPDRTIHVSTDGTPATVDSPCYTGPLRITATTQVSACVVEGGNVRATVSAEFRRGRPDPVVDLIHSDARDPDQATPPGPFDNMAVGRWISADLELHLAPGGLVLRPSVYGSPAPVGHWWYATPHDVFESPDDHGVGEIWWTGGGRSRLELSGEGTLRLDIAGRLVELGRGAWPGEARQ